MKIKVEKSGKAFEVLKAKTYHAILYSIVDLGTHVVTRQGEEKLQRKIRLSRELPTVRRTFNEEKGEQPMSIHNEYTLSFSDNSHLTKLISSWRGTPIQNGETIDLDDFLGQNCLLNVGIKTSKEGKEYNVVIGLSPLMDGQEEKNVENPIIIYEIEDGKNEVFDSFPNRLQERIEESQERSGTKIVDVDSDEKF